MKLYKVLELHGGPKSHVIFTNKYVIKDSDEEMFNYIAKEIGYYMFDEEEFEEGSYESFEELKEEIMGNKGDLKNDEGWEDAYYGVTKYGWEFVGEITKEDLLVLEKLDIIKKGDK